MSLRDDLDFWQHLDEMCFWILNGEGLMNYYTKHDIQLSCLNCYSN